ncbi:MAG: TonB family protein [Deltaproteobacteria bacterium]|nr:TonB family protein [Deltaproteobacteria bacterium]
MRGGTALKGETKKRKKKIHPAAWVISGLVPVILIFLGFVVVKKLITVDETRKVRQIQMIKVVEQKPPEPEKVEEIPPEPAIEEEIQEIIQEASPQEDMSENTDDTPAGEELGIDADGTSGSDGFGLVGKKGGRSIILGDSGGSGSSSLLKRYAWYIQKIQKEIMERLNRELEKDGGIPEGNLNATLKIVLDNEGWITDFDILGSSGSNKMDNAIQAAMKQIQIDEVPPEGMPKSIKIRVSSKG